MSKNYEKIKQYYDTGLWNEIRIRNVVGKPNGITEKEYEMIVGEKFADNR